MAYNSWNRLEEMTYPDEEKITYSYNTAGLLESVKGEKAYSYNYVNKLGYDKFEQRIYMKYCNGAETNYTYDPQRRRLSNLSVISGKTSHNLIMNNAYTYDKVDNVLSVANTAPILNTATGMGGQMGHTYNYDGLYRLVSATGTYTGANISANNAKTASYTLEMGYDNLHNITSKKQRIEQKGIQFDGVLKAGYELAYSYNSEKPHQVAGILDDNYRTEGTDAQDVTKKEHKYEYDANGNLVYVNTERPKKDGTQTPKSTERKLLWDEENRLEAIDDNGYVSNYWYDAAGERTVKTSGESQEMYVNSVFSGGDTQTANFTAYVNPYLVVSKGGQYTKHIYIGSQRIVSKLGDLDSYGADPRRIEYAGTGVDGAKVDYKGKYTALQQTIKDRYAKFEVPYYGKDNDDYVNGQGFCCDDTPKTKSFANANDNPELFQYYYHSDHLGSSSLITNLDGETVQHIEYVPFGEVFIEERNNTWNTPYLFNAKELDKETGLYYYGARYYDPRTSIWLSTDPLQEKYPSISTYVYCAQNPVKLVDPDGKDLVITGEQVKTAFNTLQKSYNKGITLTFDSNTNFVYATRNEGVELSHDEEVLYNIITSRNIEVRLETYKNDVTSDGQYIAFGGAFLGNTLFQDGMGQTKAAARQALCVPEMEMSEKAYGQSGVLYLHEISEAFEGARNSLASGIAARPALTEAEKNNPNNDYNRAHRVATPQPRIEQNPNTGDIFIEHKKRGVNANGRTDNRIMTFLKNKPTAESYFKSIIKPIKFK